MALDRRHVVKTALALLDDVGLDGLTLRRLATELGVQAPALYWHFANKQALLDEMVAEMVREVPVVAPEPGETWDEWLAGRARAMRDGLNAHRDGAMLAASTHPQGSQWAEIEFQLEVLAQAGLTEAEGMRALIALGNYVSGFTLDDQADRARERPDPDQMEAFLASLSAYPRMAAAFRSIGDPQSDDAFEAGLQIILDGLRTRVDKRSRSRAEGTPDSPPQPQPAPRTSPASGSTRH